MILDLVIEAGNPADSDRFWPMLERHIAAYGAPPRQAAADGGFASRDNLSRAKACGVRDMAFHKKSGLTPVARLRSRAPGALRPSWPCRHSPEHLANEPRRRGILDEGGQPVITPAQR